MRQAIGLGLGCGNSRHLSFLSLIFVFGEKKREEAFNCTECGKLLSEGLATLSEGRFPA